MLPAVLAAAALPGIWNALSIVVELNNQGNEKKQSVNVVPMTLKINSAWKKSKDGKHNFFFNFRKHTDEENNSRRGIKAYQF